MISEKTTQRLIKLAKITKEWDQKAAEIPIDLREELAMMFKATFHDFKEFADLGMQYLGFKISDMQLDIADYMQHGPKKRMVQAQRGEAKSTLAALYAVWCLVQDQSYRILVVSGGEKQASDIALLIIRVIENWHLFCWLRPDKSRGDRTSVEGYDVHCDLKPVDKSASIACVGITSNLPGKRADLLIPDDVETTKNSMTQTMRDNLLALTKEFSAICTHGHTLYLGTPQTKDSIYKTLPARGFDVRIWPGRYPTNEELQRYLPNTLAPMILEAIEADPSLQIGGGLAGNRGQPADPVRYNEEALLEKELDWGEEGFNLQYMLDTTLSDALRTKIKLSDFIVGTWDSMAAPEIIQYSAEPRTLRKADGVMQLQGERMYYAASSSQAFAPYMHKVMVVDPAGNGGDEVSFAAGGACSSYIHLFALGGLLGGISEPNMRTIINHCLDLEVYDIKIENNMGHGTVVTLFLAELEKMRNEGLIPQGLNFGVEGYYAVGQKEKRIIDTISPLTRRHRLVILESAVEMDIEYANKHVLAKRTIASGLYQLANITYDRGSLAMDDRADAVQGVVMHLSTMIGVDDEKAQADRLAAVGAEFVANPMGYAVNNKRTSDIRSRFRRK